MPADNFVSATVAHHKRGNHEAADRQTDLTSNFELKAIFVAGRHIRYYAFDGDSLGHLFFCKLGALSYVYALHYDKL